MIVVQAVCHNNTCPVGCIHLLSLVLSLLTVVSVVLLCVKSSSPYVTQLFLAFVLARIQTTARGSVTTVRTPENEPPSSAHSLPIALTSFTTSFTYWYGLCERLFALLGLRKCLYYGLYVIAFLTLSFNVSTHSPSTFTTTSVHHAQCRC